MIRERSGTEDELGSDLYWMSVDFRAAQAAERFIQQREFRKQFCKEYKQRLLNGIDIADAAVQTFSIFGLISDVAQAAVAIVKVASQISIENWCEEFS